MARELKVGVIETRPPLDGLRSRHARERRPRGSMINAPAPVMYCTGGGADEERRIGAAGKQSCRHKCADGWSRRRRGESRLSLEPLAA